jgi:phosphate starvation-inducible protein PhoH
MSKKTRKQRHNFAQNFQLKAIGPETLGQQRLFDLYEDIPHLVLNGYAGTGKTFCALFLALEEMMCKSTPYTKIIVVRSAVPTRDQGFLPGSLDEKMEVYEAPYKSIFNELFGRADAFECFKKRNEVEILSTSYLRGITIDDAIIIVDEAQNMTFHELDSLVTRVGVNTRLMMCGDILQNDLQMKRGQYSGYQKMMNIFYEMDCEHVEFINFDKDDIIRSGFVKEYIIAKSKVD